MPFIDMLKWDPESNDVYAWKFPETNLSTFAQLVVHESQEAVFFSKGQLLGKFGPGKHTLTSENLPLLRNLFGIPFGGKKKNPFTAELWFVNRAVALNVPWETEDNPIWYKEPEYNVPVPLMAKGQYGVKIADAEKFLVKLVGTLPHFGSRALTSHFKGELFTKMKSAISQKIQTERIGILQIDMYLDMISTYLKQVLNQFFNDYGMELVGFHITKLGVDENNPEGAKILKAISERSSTDIQGVSYKEDRMLDIMEKSSTQNNAAGGMMGTMAAMGLGSMMGNMGAMNMNPTTPNVQQPAAQNQSAPMVTCSKCGTKYPNTAKFCPNCGDVYNPCPSCGADNDVTSTKCMYCGTQLGMKCPQCNTLIQSGNKFCPNCGYKVVNVCSRCQTEVPANTKFCPNCGNKIGEE